MAQIRIEHPYDCSIDDFWNRIFFDDEYNRRLYSEGLGFPSAKIVSTQDSPTELRREMDVVPKTGDLPGPIKKLVGDGLGYREKGVFDKATRRWKNVVVTSALSDKIKITGELWLEPRGEKKSTRIFTCTVKVDVFGLGGTLEKRIVSDLETNYEAAARFTNKFIAEKGL